MYPRTEMLDVIVIDGKARASSFADLVTGKIESHIADAVVLGTGGYGNVFYLSTMQRLQLHLDLARTTNAAPRWPPLLTQIHPHCIPVSAIISRKLTLMSESLRNDGRIWVPLKKATSGRQRNPERERDYYLERRYPASETWCLATSPSRAAKAVCVKGAAWERALGVYLDFADAGHRLGKQAEGTLQQPFEMSNAFRRGSLRCADAYLPAITNDGRTLVDYNLMTTVLPDSFRSASELSDHGANRLGAAL